MSKPIAYIYEEGDGMFTIHCPSKEKAVKLFQKLMDEEYADRSIDEPVVVDIDLIQQDRAFTHRKCNGWMIGEPICWDCGEPTSYIGIKMFTYKL